MESKNLSILITDIQGYSHTSATSSRTDLMTFIDNHRRLLKPVVEFYRGTVVKSLGDSFLCTFESATDAAVCAIAIQMIVHEFNRQNNAEGGKPLHIRVVINSGDVSIKNGDIFGDAVNLTARMEKIPELSEGGIGISESTYLLMNRKEIFAEPMGSFEFKGIDHPVQVYRIPLNGQKLSELPTRLSDLVQRVVKGEEFTTTIQLDPKIQKSSPKWIKYGLMLGAVLLAAYAVVAFQKNQEKRRLNQRAFQLLDIIRRSDPQRTGAIPKDHFVGPEELFRELDKNGDSVITMNEVLMWAQERGIELPQPGGRPRDSMDGPRPPDGGRPRDSMDGPRPPDGGRPRDSMDRPRPPDGGRPRDSMDGPRPPDGGRPRDSIDGPRPPDGGRPRDSMDGPRPPDGESQPPKGL